MRAAAIALMLSLSIHASARGQGSSADAEQVKPLVVMITCAAASGAESFGAGIIVGTEADRVQVATASHVVRPCPEHLQVSFLGNSRTFKATVVQQADQPLDLAALAVPGVPASRLSALPLDRLGDPTILKRGDALYLIGNPAGEEWSLNDTPDRMVRTEGDLLYFTSTTIAQGHSGGTLLNGRGEVVGMIVADSRTGSRAVSITRVLQTLRGWKVPVGLRVPLPRISAGEMRTCAITAAGAGSCWGNIQFDQPGMFDSVLSLGRVRFKSLSVGLLHVCGVAFNGAAYCIGMNNYGQLGNGSTKSSEETPVPAQGGLVLASLTAGGWHTCGLAPDGTAYCWGAGTGGRLGNDAGEDSHVPVPVAGGLSFKSISAGLRNTCGVTVEGALYCWGGMQGSGLERGGADPDNAFVPLHVGGKLTFSSAIAGQDFGCGVATDSTAYCWGLNEEGELGVGTTRKGMTEAGLTPQPVAGGHKFASVSLGLGLHACAVTPSGEAYCWGWNSEGQLGNGSKTSSHVPVAVAGGLRFASLAIGHFHTCGVALDGAIYCWGSTDSAGIGTGTTTGSTKPVRVPKLP